MPFAFKVLTSVLRMKVFLLWCAPSDSPDLRPGEVARRLLARFRPLAKLEPNRPLLEEALEQGGFWTEVFDADGAREGWMSSGSSADCLAIAHLLPSVLGETVTAQPLAS